MWLGAYLGGPLVAGYLIAENFKLFNEINKAKKTWIFTIIGTILIFSGVFLIPENVFENIPKYIIPLTYTAIAYSLMKHYQDKNIKAFIVLGGKSFSWGRTIIVSLIGLAITVVSIFSFIFLSYFIANA